MTDDELKAIEARTQAATPGPWETTSGDAVDGSVAVWRPDGKYICYVGPAALGSIRVPHDERFIAHARQDVLALVAALRASQARALAAEGLLKLAQEHIGLSCDPDAALLARIDAHLRERG